MKIPYVDIAGQFARDREKLMPKIESVLEGGMHVNAPAVSFLEKKLANFHNSAECVCLNSGTDALVFSLKALGIGPGDEVITQANSFIASTAAIIQLGATPVFADVLDDQSLDPAQVAALITAKTKAIMPVHLTGRVAQMPLLQEIATQHGLFIIEDAAQAIGATFQGQKAGTFGNIGCFSAHPLKNLGACGDAGFIITDDETMAKKIRLMRNHGLATRDIVLEFGQVSRMDALQAVILSTRLEMLDLVTRKRQTNAALYQKLLNPTHIFTPRMETNRKDCYHTFVIHVKRRDDLQKYLTKNEIGSAIHYPIPIHLQPAANNLGYKKGSLPVTEDQAKNILSLPIHELLETAQIEHVANMVNRFYENA